MKDTRKIIIYGTGRYPKDFLYVFENIQVAYYVDDEEIDGAKCWKTLKNEKDFFVIICKYDERVARENLNKMGLKKGEDYISASDWFYKLDFPVKDIAKKRDIYIWGTGDVSHSFFHDFVENNPDIEIIGCIDSDFQKRGKTFFRRPIYSPEEVLVNSNNFYIIASTRYYQEIKEYLLAHGKKEGDDFISSFSINQRASWMIRETIYDMPKLDYVCPKAFQDVALMHEGRLSVCAGVKNVSDWNVPLFCSEFGKAWHSNIMKILRLSMINGTYSFCSAKKCDLIRNCGIKEIDTNEMHYFLHRSKEQMDYIAQKKELSKNLVFRESNYTIRENEYPDVIMCSFDRTCNLKCPSCRDGYYIEHRQKEILKRFVERIKIELLPYANRIKVAGDGEAFASELYRSIIFDSELAGKIHNLGILSNGTLLTPSNFEKISELYDSIKIFVSMDGCTKETAEKLRSGADFGRWMDNMRYLGKKRKEGKIKFLAFNFVVQKDNYKEMPGYVEMCLGFHADAIKFSPIFNWGRYSTDEFEEISMFDENNNMKPELAEVVKDEIFRRDEVHMFTWLDW